MLTFVHDERGTFSNVLLHPYLPDVHSSSFTAFAATICLLLHWRVGTHFSGRYPFAVKHLQSLTTGLCLGTQQLTYFLRLSTNSLVALDCVCVIVSKIRPFLRANKFTWTLLFSNARWLFDTLQSKQLSKQSVSVTLNISLNIYRQFFCWNI
jgi:hypothetical protein